MAKAEKVRLKLLTPEKIVFDDDVDMVVLDATEGKMGVLANHESLTTALEIGVLKVHNNDKVEQFAVFGGFASIDRNVLTVLSDLAEKPDEIDAERARRAKERAERRISEKQANLDEARLKVAHRKAMVRLELTGIPMTNEKKK